MAKLKIKCDSSEIDFLQIVSQPDDVWLAIHDGDGFKEVLFTDRNKVRKLRDLLTEALEMEAKP